MPQRRIDSRLGEQYLDREDLLTLDPDARIERYTAQDMDDVFAEMSELDRELERLDAELAEHEQLQVRRERRHHVSR